MKDFRKITAIELLILTLMLLAFLAALCFLVYDDRDYALLFFVLHAVLGVVYFYVIQDRHTQTVLRLEEEASEYSKEGLEEKRRQIEELTAEKADLIAKQTLSDGKLEALASKNEMLQRKVSQLELENTSSKGQAGLLPEGEQVTGVDLLSVIRKVYEQFTPACSRRGIRLELSTSFMSVNMQCDENYMRILFSNIIDNAMKYMNRSGSFIITLSDIGEEGIFLVCKDNGNGLPAQEAGEVFTLNYQGSNRKEGNGLGLVQAKAIVEHYNGRVYARCGENEGMAIYIQFPVESKG